MGPRHRHAQPLHLTSCDSSLGLHPMNIPVELCGHVPESRICLPSCFLWVDTPCQPSSHTVSLNVPSRTHGVTTGLLVCRSRVSTVPEADAVFLHRSFVCSLIVSFAGGICDHPSDVECGIDCQYKNHFTRR